jgi:AMMECR1 domain-containing protein
MSARLAALLLVSMVAPPAGARQGGERHTPREEALIALARGAVRAAVEGRAAPAVSGTEPAQGVFVTVERGATGEVVGCRGSLLPRCRSLEEELAQAARSAAAYDPRYKPLTPAVLRDFRVTVTLVDRLEPLDRAAIAALTPEDGLVLRAGDKTGVVLPYEGRDPRVRLRWAYRKAGIPEGAPCSLLRMAARRFRG